MHLSQVPVERRRHYRKVLEKLITEKSQTAFFFFKCSIEMKNHFPLDKY